MEHLRGLLVAGTAHYLLYLYFDFHRPVATGELVSAVISQHQLHLGRFLTLLVLGAFAAGIFEAGLVISLFLVDLLPFVLLLAVQNPFVILPQTWLGVPVAGYSFGRQQNVEEESMSGVIEQLRAPVAAQSNNSGTFTSIVFA